MKPLRASRWVLPALACVLVLVGGITTAPRPAQGLVFDAGDPGLLSLARHTVDHRGAGVRRIEFNGHLLRLEHRVIPGDAAVALATLRAQLGKGDDVRPPMQEQVGAGWRALVRLPPRWVDPGTWSDAHGPAANGFVVVALEDTDRAVSDVVSITLPGDVAPYALFGGADVDVGGEDNTVLTRMPGTRRNLSLLESTRAHTHCTLVYRGRGSVAEHVRYFRAQVAVQAMEILRAEHFGLEAALLIARDGRGVEYRVYVTREGLDVGEVIDVLQIREAREGT